MGTSRIVGAALVMVGIAIIGTGLLISGNPEPNISPILGRWFGFWEGVLITSGLIVFASGIGALTWRSPEPSKV